MKKGIVKILSGLLATVIVSLEIINPITTYAAVPYNTYTQDGYNDYVGTQTAYIPEAAIIKIVSDDESIPDITLNKPQDIKISSDGFLYIADTDSARVIKATLEGKLVKVFGEGQLAKPNGLFVTDEGLIYVADSEYRSKIDKLKNPQGAVVVFNQEGNIVHTYERPTSPLYGTTTYQPLKIAVDTAGNLYVSSSGNTNGIIQISPKDGGTFLGYFGTNKTEVSLMQMFLNLILSEEQKAANNPIIPVSVTNLCIDDKNLLYTLVKSTTSTEPLKKLNVAGTNLIALKVLTYECIAVSVGKYENIFAASANGVIYEYSKEGTLLFMFGGKDFSENRVGLFNNITSIDVTDDDKIYVLDGGNSEIQVFKPTEFTELIHESLELYQKGLYAESMDYLQQIIRMNSLFNYANQAMGQALYKVGDYEKAIDYFELANDRLGYSDSYWEIRNVWLNDYLVISVGILILIVIIIKILNKLDKKYKLYDPIRKLTAPLRKTLTYQRVVFGFKYMKHPIDGAYGVKKEKMKGFWSSAILLGIVIAINIVSKYFCGFLVKTVREGEYNILSDVVVVIAGMLIASAITYLICAIRDGEGRFTEILQGYIYSFTPLIVIKPFIYLFGLVVTNNELFLITFANVIMIAWILLLIFLSVKEINNYTVKETIKTILITIFAAVVFALIAFIIYVLAVQVGSFIYSVYGEAVYRIGK